MTSNQLGNESSPYLRQHRENPVHWIAWGDAAFEESRKTGKPVLLSVGYAACHWCHVMAHESFEDDRIASVMNERYVNIKVDREERPDLDAIYQHALALLGEQGGWPLTMFLNADAEPFWGGTYFPPEPKYGRPGFQQVLEQISAIYKNEPDKVVQNVTGLKQALAQLSVADPGGEISMDISTRIAESLLGHVDRVYGGIGSAPKFPQPAIFEMFYRTWRRTDDKRFLDATLLTLDRMCQGGIYDHLGGGFSRYTVDGEWLVPHFEKMLYDNAQLLQLLTMVWKETRTPLYAQRVRETIDWLLREMVVDGGGFAGTLDADSEGEEGKFYVWSAEEIADVLGAEAEAFGAIYDVNPAGNWEGKSILNRGAHPQMLEPEMEHSLAAAREKLLARRADRIRPERDDKVLADWNGMMIAALAECGTVFALPEARDAAIAAFEFVSNSMQVDGRLRHSWSGDAARHPATLDDYANMADAAIALYEMTGEDWYLEQAAGWVETIETHFSDADGGGYFLSADDVADVIVRTKSIQDNATPSGNAVLVRVLAKLFYLTADAQYRNRAEALIKAFSGTLEKNVFGISALINANELLQNAVQAVLIADNPAAGGELASELVQSPAPNLVVQRLGADASLPAGHPAAGKTMSEGNTTVYICRDQSCSLPVTDSAALAKVLAG